MPAARCWTSRNRARLWSSSGAGDRSGRWIAELSGGGEGGIGGVGLVEFREGIDERVQSEQDDGIGATASL